MVLWFGLYMFGLVTRFHFMRGGGVGASCKHQVKNGIDATVIVGMQAIK